MKTRRVPVTLSLVAAVAFSVPASAQESICRKIDQGRAICTHAEMVRIQDWMARARERISLLEVELSFCEEGAGVKVLACQHLAEVTRRLFNAKMALLQDELEVAQTGGATAWARWWSGTGLWATIAGTALGVIAGAVLYWRLDAR